MTDQDDAALAPESQETTETISGVAGTVTGEEVRISNGFVGAVTARRAEVQNAGALLITSSGELRVEGSGGVVLLSIGRMSINGGGGSTIIAGGDLRIQEGGGAFLFAPRATLERSNVGILLTGNADLRDGTRVLLDTPRALALGAALGLVFALLGRLLRR